MSDLVLVIQRLRDRIRELEELLGLRERVDMIEIVDCNYRRRVQTIIRLLLRRELVSRDAISLAFGGEEHSQNSIYVYVSHARAALRPHGITIKCDRGRGWYLRIHDRAKLRALMRGDANGAAA